MIGAIVDAVVSAVVGAVVDRVADRGAGKQEAKPRGAKRSSLAHATPRATAFAVLVVPVVLVVLVVDGKVHPSAFCSDMLLLPPKLTLARLGCFPSPDPAATGAASQDRRRATARTLARRVPADGRIAPLRTVQIQAYFFAARKGRWRPKRRISRDSGPCQRIGPFRKDVAKKTLRAARSPVAKRF